MKYSAFGTALLIGDDGQAFTGEADDDLLTAAAHGLANATPVMLQGTALPTGLLDVKVYYVRDTLTNTLKLAATAGGSAINLTADGSGVVRSLAEIAQVRSISGPSFDVDAIDVTTHDSPPPFREFIAGLIDTGEFSLDVLYDPQDATHIAALEDLVGRVAQTFALVFPNLTATTWAFTGIVSGFAFQAPTDAELSASVTIKLTGDANVG